MQILAQSLLFILSKWDTSMDEFYPIGKVLFYIPCLLNSILTQFFYFVLSPIIYLYFMFKENIDEYSLFIRLILTRILY